MKFEVRQSLRHQSLRHQSYSTVVPHNFFVCMLSNPESFGKGIGSDSSVKIIHIKGSDKPKILIGASESMDMALKQIKSWYTKNNALPNRINI